MARNKGIETMRWGVIGEEAEGLLPRVLQWWG